MGWTCWKRSGWPRLVLREETARSRLGYSLWEANNRVSKSPVWFVMFAYIPPNPSFWVLFCFLSYALGRYNWGMASISICGEEAAAAKSLQSCPTPRDPIDGSPPGSPVPGILQAGTLEWVATAFSNARVHAQSLQSCLTLCDPTDGSPPGSSAHEILQARTLEWVAMSFSREEANHF